MRLAAFLVSALALGFAACGPQGWAEAEQAAQTQCYVEAFRKRGTETDLCLAECMEAGSAENIGGGCYHFCGLPDEDPPGLDSCSLAPIRRQLEAAGEQ